MDIREHYENHLANYYSWMFGNFDAKVNENQRFFQSHNIKPLSSKVCIDLGAGCGFQSIPLAKIGFKVKAVDFSERLLNELKGKIGGLDIESIMDDILNFDAYSGYDPELMVCMGDTITHLDSLGYVQELIKNSYKFLKKNGKLIVTFRDLTYELKEEGRFIPVKSDIDRIFTCFLEYYPDYVKVFDIFHERKNGKWNQKISSYKKLKIPQAVIEKYFQDSGFKIEFMGVENGLVAMIGKKQS